MRWSLFSLIAAAVLTLTLHAITRDTAALQPARLVPLACPELVRLCATSYCRHPSATANTSCTGPPGADITKPATNDDTTSTTNHEQNYSCRDRPGRRCSSHRASVTCTS
jgi:hypothetical protein